MGAGAYVRTYDDEEVYIFPIDVDQDLSAAADTVAGLAKNPVAIPRALSDANDAVQKSTNIDPFGYVSTFTALRKAA
jgi:hypothetical protein